MQFLGGFLGILNQISNVLDIPQKFLGILGLISTFGGYLTGRRAARVQTPEAIVAAALAQLGYAAPAAALGSGAPAAVAAHAGTAVEVPPASPQVASAAPTAVAPPPLGPAPLATTVATAFPAVPAYAAGAQALPRGGQRKGLWQRASYPWLAIVSIVGLACSVLSYVFLTINSAAISAGTTNDAATELLGLFGILVWVIGFATIIWGAVRAVRLRRWGWLTSIVLIGLAGMLFLAPSVITLLFALVGPKMRRAAKGATLPVAPRYYPQAAVPQATPTLWMPQHGSPQQWASPPPQPQQPMPFPSGAQQPASYPGWQQPQPSTNPPMPPMPAGPAGPQQPWTYLPGYAPASPQPPTYPPAMAPQLSQMPQQPAPPLTPAFPMRQAGPGAGAPPDAATSPTPSGIANPWPPQGAPGVDHP